MRLLGRAWITVGRVLGLCAGASAQSEFCAPYPGDADGDSVCDAIDNCRLIANPTQCDLDRDGFGSHCDGDLNNSGGNTGLDFLIFGRSFAPPATVPPSDPNADMNCDTLVDDEDFPALRSAVCASGATRSVLPATEWRALFRPEQPLEHDALGAEFGIRHLEVTQGSPVPPNRRGALLLGN